MGIRLRCEHCRTPLRVRDELAGRRVRCPRCGNGQRVEPPQSEGDEPTPCPSTRIADEGCDSKVSTWRPEFAQVGPLQRVRTGLKLIWQAVRLALVAGITLVVLGIVLRIVGLGEIMDFYSIEVGNARGEREVEYGGAAIEAFIRGLVMLVVVTMLVIGQIYCLAVPPKHGARLLALATLCTTVVGTLLIACGGSIERAGIIGDLLLLGSVIVFLLFMRAVALLLRDAALSRTAICLIIGIGGCVMVQLLILLSAVLPGTAGILMIVLLGPTDLLLCLGTTIWFIIYISQVRKALERWLALETNLAGIGER
jgi:predicted Zn finger-like uncharacterized protein